MEFSGVQLYLLWTYLTVGIFVYGVFVIYLPSIVPSTFVTIYKYGKSAEKCKRWLLSDLLAVPKRWFLHFYICACCSYVFLFWSVIQVYSSGQSCPVMLKTIISYLSPKLQIVPVAPASVMVAIVLLMSQILRRLYECLFVSVFSDASMSLLHYAFGLFFYPAVGMSLILEAPGFTDASIPKMTSEDFMKPHIIFGTLLFICGWCIEFHSTCILSGLRRNDKGVVVHTRYVIPEGGFFKFVSCPHYFGEVLMYLAVLVIFAGRNVTWWTVFLNVLTNQIMAALMSHHWYKNKFKNYPRERKALIPLLL